LQRYRTFNQLTETGSNSSVVLAGVASSAEGSVVSEKLAIKAATALVKASMGDAGVVGVVGVVAPPFPVPPFDAVSVELLLPPHAVTSTAMLSSAP
jgi:hypothetical protein